MKLVCPVRLSGLLLLLIVTSSHGSLNDIIRQKHADAEKQDADLGLSVDFCRKLMKTHKPRADVAYRGGVDVHGRPVAPADLNGMQIKLPSRVKMNVVLPRISGTAQDGADGAAFFDIFPHAPAANRPFHTYPFIGDIPLGEVEFDLETNELYFQGQKIGSANRQALEKACTNVLNKP